MQPWYACITSDRESDAESTLGDSAQAVNENADSIVDETRDHSASPVRGSADTCDDFVNEAATEQDCVDWGEAAASDSDSDWGNWKAN